MKSRMILLAAVMVSAVTVSGCSRPEGGWLERFHGSSEPTPTEAINLLESQVEAGEDLTELFDEFERLLSDLDASISAESDWQLDVPDEPEPQDQSQPESEVIDSLLAELELAMQSLGDALARESSQEAELP